MEDATPILPVKSQKRFVGSAPSDRGEDADSNAGDVGGDAPSRLTDENAEPDRSARSNVLRTPSTPKKFSGSSLPTPGASWEAADSMTGPTLFRDTEQRKRSKKRSSLKNQFSNLKKNFSIQTTLFVGLASACASGVLFFILGLNTQRPKEAVEISQPHLEVAPEALALMDEIFQDLQDRKGQSALEKIGKLRSFSTNLSSVSILAATAALLEKDFEKTERESQEALLKKQSESDAFVLQALVILDQLKDNSYKTMGNPRNRVESLLRRAIAADPLDPQPYTLLAAVKRAAGESREALALLQSSRLRQSALTDTIVTEAAIHLVQMEMVLDADLPELNGESKPSVLDQISTAYLAMRRGNIDAAVSNLTQARGTLPPEVFTQILADPAFSTYSKDSHFVEFFKNQ